MIAKYCILYTYSTFVQTDMCIYSMSTYMKYLKGIASGAQLPLTGF